MCSSCAQAATAEHTMKLAEYESDLRRWNAMSDRERDSAHQAVDQHSLRWSFFGVFALAFAIELLAYGLGKADLLQPEGMVVYLTTGCLAWVLYRDAFEVTARTVRGAVYASLFAGFGALVGAVFGWIFPSPSLTAGVNDVLSAFGLGAKFTDSIGLDATLVALVAFIGAIVVEVRIGWSGTATPTRPSAPRL
ncbi:MAG: hypothetical protein WCG80_19255 [Spirochaetales bacterium]